MNVRAILEEFRKVDLPIQTALTFVLVAEVGEKGILMKELGRWLSLPTSSIIRNVQALAECTDAGKMVELTCYQNSRFQGSAGAARPIDAEDKRLWASLNGQG
jgi:hypothetical protein